MSKATDNRVHAVERAFEVIQVLRDMEVAGVTEIADSLDLPKSTVHNHLATLENLNYVTAADGEYRLSLRFLKLGEQSRQQTPMYPLAKEEIDGLAESTSANAYLTVEQNGYGIIIYRNMTNEINLGDFVGRAMPLTSTASGKAILAHLDSDRVDEILEQHGLPEMTENTITERVNLQESFDEIRDKGYAFGRGEQVSGLRAIGSPITGPDDTVYGAISIAGPKQVMRGEEFEDELPEQVLSTANIVELKLLEGLSLR
jgi:DNA-binding IclR family transcriptional regulator